MRIGVISDTHGVLDDKVFRYFRTCDEIWHAGDIGTMDVLTKLEGFKPVRAVWGNIDGHELRAAVPENQLFELEGKRIFITHIAAKPPKYNPAVRKVIAGHRPDVLICGHSHILRVENDKTNDLLFMNPGAAGVHGFHKVKTLLRFELHEGRLFDLEVVELGKRAALNQ